MQIELKKQEKTPRSRFRDSEEFEEVRLFCEQLVKMLGRLTSRALSTGARQVMLLNLQF